MSGENGTPKTTEELLQEILEQQQEHRAEVAALREELDAAKQAPPVGPPATNDPEALRQARLDHLAAHDYYCPGCGATGDYPQKCSGKGEAPHPPIEMVSTDEVKNAPDPGDQEAFLAWQKGHTAAPVTA